MLIYFTYVPVFKTYFSFFIFYFILFFSPILRPTTRVLSYRARKINFQVDFERDLSYKKWPLPLHSHWDNCYQLVFDCSWFPGSSAGEESARTAGNLGLISGLGRSPGEGNGYPRQCSAWRIPWTAVCGVAEADTTERLSLSLHCGSSNSKEPACNTGVQASTPGLESSSGEGNGSPLQYPCLENSTDKAA